MSGLLYVINKLGEALAQAEADVAELERQVATNAASIDYRCQACGQASGPDGHGPRDETGLLSCQVDAP